MHDKQNEVAIIAKLEQLARDHEANAEAYRRRGDDYNADHSEGQATKIYNQIAWIKGEV